MRRLCFLEEASNLGCKIPGQTTPQGEILGKRLRENIPVGRGKLRRETRIPKSYNYARLSSVFTNIAQLANQVCCLPVPRHPPSPVHSTIRSARMVHGFSFLPSNLLHLSGRE